MYMLDFVFHLSIDRHLGYVHFFSYVQYCCYEYRVHKHLFKSLFSILLGIYPEVELLNHIVILCLIF